MGCKLKLKNGQSGVYTAESIQELQTFIYNAFTDALFDSDGGANASALKIGLKRALYKIGDEYNDQRQVREVARQVEAIIKSDDFSGLDWFLPEAGILNTLSPSGRPSYEEVMTQDTFAESDTTKEELGFIKSQFLDNFLGTKARLKNQLKQDVTHKLLSTFIIDRENGKIIANIGEANRAAREYKQQLFNQVVQYLRANAPGYNLTATSLYDGDKYTGVLSEAKMFTRFLDSYTPAQLQAIHDSNINKYNAITAWFTLKNFDNFVNYLIGDVIKVHPEHKGRFKDGDGYTYSDKGSQVITSWRTNDNIVLESEIGALAQSLINSTPFYKFGIDNKSNKFIKFEDFYRIITKIKDLALDPKAANIIFDRDTYPFLFEDGSDLTLEEQELIENKSLRTIINNIRVSPQLYTRLATRLLIQGNNMKTLGFTEEERDKTYSIYKGFFSSKDKESLYKIQNQGEYDHNTKNYYSLITQVADSLFTVNYLQYNEDDGTISVRTLKDQGADNIRRRLETSIVGFNSRRIIGTDFERQQMEPYNMSPINNDTNDKFEGIMFTIKMEDDMVTDTNYDLTVALTDLGKTMTIYDSEGHILHDKDLTGLLYSSEFKQFIDDQLNLGLATDRDLLEAIDTVYSDSGDVAAAKDLLKIAANVYMNKYVSNVLLKDVKGRKRTINKLKSIIPEDAPTYNSTLGEINLVPESMIPLLNRIAAAKSITTGEAQSAQVRDAEGNMLSSQTLSRLLGSLQSQWERILESPDHAASEFSLLQGGLFKGCHTTKEYKSLAGSKPHTQFTVAESIQGNFLYDFVGGFMNVDNTSGKKVIGNNVIGLLPSVNSDKNTIGRMILDLDQECKVPGISTLTQLGRNKKWAELTIDELQQVIAIELGRSYQKTYDNVIADFKQLQDWLSTVKSVNVIINPETDFRELNEYCENINKEKANQLLQSWIAQQENLNIPITSEDISKQYDKYYKKVSKSTSAMLYEWTKEYNDIHSNNPIRLIEQTHYVNNGSGIKFNNTFKALMRRYNDPQKLAEFFDMKRTEMLKSLVDENVEIDLFSESTTKSTPKKWLLEKYPDWVHKIDSNGTVVKNGKMVLAKLTYNGTTYSITSKADLVAFNNVVRNTAREVSLNFINTPHKLLNPKYGIKVELHPMLDKYNTMDYLFTQEFMIAGVGSHINHPGKAKYKTDVIWAHPGIGKTYVMENSKYKDQVMDWDVEFNHRRDAWIAQQTKTIKGTDAYKQARNEYLINWKSHPDFQKFVKNEWKRIKQLANSQNKMLVASPHMLLQLFPDDFNQVLTMDRDDFIQRNVARGANNAENSALWKDGIDATINSLATNPVYGKKIVTVGKGEYLQNMLDNGKLYNVLAQLRENEMQEEAARFLAQHKRNVSYTAAMHEFQLDSITGIPTEYNMAIIDDIKAPVYTISGDRGNHAPFDGATFVNPLVVIWENNSLEGDKAGIDKKQFVHYYDEKTGTGGIIKTAGFGLTNDRIRRYQFYRDMVHNMLNNKWKNDDGTQHIAREGGILVDFNGKDVNYGPVYFKSGNDYYMREILSYEGNNNYKIRTTKVDITGELMEDSESIEELLPVESNYDVWNMFGGHNSMDFKDGELKPSEKSIQLTARAANNYGTLREGITKAITAKDVIQPMKHSDIHYMPTVGAIKQGACNINPKSCYYGHNKLNFMKVKMYQAGIQLDKEHHADNSELSLMTQVISAACANGYNPEIAKRLYNAIYSLTKAGTREFRNELGNMLTGDSAKFDQAVTGVIMKAMLNSTSSDGDLVQAIAQDLLKEMKTSQDFSFSPEFYDKADSIIPNSDPSIYPKIVNMLTVALTKSGIKTKMPGILAVLCPSHEILKFYKIPIVDENNTIIGYKRGTIDKLEEAFGGDINAALDKLQSLEDPIESLADIEMGYKYLIHVENGTPEGAYEVVHVNRIHGDSQNEQTRKFINPTTNKEQEITYREISYEELKTLKLREIKEWVKEGQDLKSYNVRFEDEQGNRYQMADLDIVQDYFKLKDLETTDEQIMFAINLLDKYGKHRELAERVAYDLRKSWGNKSIVEEFLNVIANNPQSIVEFCDNYKNNDGYGNLGKQFKSYLNRRLIHFMNREMQLSLNGISPDSSMNTVMVNGQTVTIKKDSIKTSTYGLVMPKTFKTNLGLDEFDDLEDIKNDPLFFVRKLAKKFGTRVESYEDENGNLINNFHLELKRSNGNHIYIRKGLTGSDLVKKVDWFKRTDEEGNVYRIDENNQVMYQMHSAEDEIYMDNEGNEIIVTSDDTVTWTDQDGNEVDITTMKPVMSAGGTWIDEKTGNGLIRKLDSGIQFYLDSMDYSSFNISRAASDNEFETILNKAQNSTNQNTSKLAGRIALRGDKKKGTEKIMAMRSLVNRMNNYEAMLEDAELKDFAMQHLKELGEQMHTSFLRSLEIIAARIPAQSQQSFMSMQVEAYDNPDINSAYVSLFQFYLQGSDLDIDAVSLQTFELGRNGLYVGHSPYYNLSNEDMRKASDTLPFPSGVKTQTKTVGSIKDSTIGILVSRGYFGFANKFGMRGLFDLDTRNDGTVNVKLNLETPQDFQRFGQFLTMINEDGFNVTNDAEYTKFALALADRYKDTGKLTLPMIGSITDQLIKIIDNHNLYIEKAKPKKREQIIKNYVTAQLREIIDDPINRRQADSSVDVVTGPAKDLAKLSPKATVQTTFTPGNVVNKFQSISENMVGKDGIAICATGLKSFFALTEMYQEILNKHMLDESDPNNRAENIKIMDAKNSLLFDVSFGGKVYRGLANGHAKEYKSPYETNITEEVKEWTDKQFSEEVQNYLLDQLWASDAANEMSSLLGLSTDNAKELVLAKINAGTASIGMYLYGLSIGIPFEQLYEVMTSPLAFRLTELTKGDSFNNNPGTNNIVGALRYLTQEPVQQLYRFNNIDLSEYKDAELPVQLLQSAIMDVLYAGTNEATKKKIDDSIEYKGIIRTLLEQTKNSGDVKRVLDGLRGEVTKNKKYIKDEKVFERYEVLYNQAIDFVKQYTDDAFLLLEGTFKTNIYGGSNLYDDLEVLATGAEEMKQLGKILRLNQEIKTNASDLLGQVANIEEAIIRRARQYKSQLGRKGINKKNFKGDPEIKKIIFSKKLDKPFSEGGYKIDIEQFMTNPTYAEQVIQIYDRIKQSYNSLRVLKTVPHYKGYSESLYSAYKGLKNKSVKFRIVSDRVGDFSKKYNIIDAKMKEQTVKNAEKAVDLYMRQSWMKSYIKPITLPASTDSRTVYAFIDNTQQTRVLNYNTEIKLGTELGDANYKLWMETVVIPELKRMYPDNKFIQGLQPVVNTKTNLGSVSINYGLPINMMPKTDYERDSFNDYKEAFNQLISLPTYADGKGQKLSIQDMFYYYSLIANGGRMGPTSLQGIFEDYINREGVSDAYNAPKSFRTFISKADASEAIYGKINAFITDEMMAPFASPYSTGTDILRYRDKDTDKIDLYIKPAIQTETERSGYEDYGYDDMMMEYMGGYDEMMANFHDTKANINGFERKTKEAVFHNNDNRNYFQNPIAVTDLAKATVISLTAEEKEQFPYLAKYNITVANVKGKFGLADITANNPEDRKIVDEYIKRIRKERKGFLISAIAIDGSVNDVLVKKQINAELEALENNCI